MRDSTLATVQGKAMDWYARMPPKSISFWLDFCQLFIERLRHDVLLEKKL